MGKELLIAEGISKEYRSKKVVDSVSLKVKQGEIVGLLGPNGAGKTTSFYIIVGLIQANKGKIYLGNQNITSLPMYKRAQKGIGYLAQEASVFRNLSVKQNLDIALSQSFSNPARLRIRREQLINEFNS